MFLILFLCEFFDVIKIRIVVNLVDIYNMKYFINLTRTHL